MTSTSGVAVWILPAVVLALVLGVIGYVVIAEVRVPDGPAEIVWDKTPCAECAMHVGEPAFAAQLRTDAGRTLAFDDPGCLFLHLPEVGAAARGIWFHHLRRDEWIPADGARFVPAAPTPMGFGLGAVTAAEAPDGLTFDRARAQVLAGDEGR